MKDSVESQIAAWLGVDLSNPVEKLAVDLASSDREFIDALVAHRRDTLTQTEVADRMGISQSAVSQFESGDRDPQLSTIRRYALALGVMVEHRIVEPERAQQIRTDAVRALSVLRGADRRHSFGSRSGHGPSPHSGAVALGNEGPYVAAYATT